MLDNVRATEELEQIFAEARAGRFRRDPDWLRRRLIGWFDKRGALGALRSKADTLGDLGALCRVWLEQRSFTRWTVRVFKRRGGVLLDEFCCDNLIPTQGADWIANLFTPAQSSPQLYIGLLGLQQTATTGSITSGSNNLTFSTAPSPALIVGQAVSVAGAGASGANLLAFVGTVVSSTSYDLVTTLNGSTPANAGTTVSGVSVQCGPAFAITDTLATRTDFFTGFSNSPLPDWTPGAVSGTNPVSRVGAAQTFDITASSGTLCGGTLQDQSAVAASYSSGNLIGEVQFTNASGQPLFQPVASGNAVSVTVTLNTNAG
jgi:hypothetical protein